MSERDDFDRIVEGLELDLRFPDEPADPAPQPAQPIRSSHRDEDVDDDDEPQEQAEEEPFYRRVPATPVVPRRRGPLTAWIGVVGVPVALLAAMLLGQYVPRLLVAASALTFVAGAIYLFLQLPEHGPSRRDWPDDGAVL